MVEQKALTLRIPVRVGDSEPKLYDSKIIPYERGVCVQMYYGPKIGWSFVTYFHNEKEAREWLKGGVPSSPNPKRKL